MSDEEEDYMSDKFLPSLDEVRPSLIHDRAKKRQIEVSKQQVEHSKRQRHQQLERRGGNTNERLQESLKRPIEADNKGFQLLAKMGYKPGQALGKESTAPTKTEAGSSRPLIEPIGISIKEGRGGLGREAALRELLEKRQQLRAQRLHKAAAVGSVTIEEFRQRATQKAEERFVLGALRRCQLTCENLDTESQVETPEMSWFWPVRITEQTAEDDQTDEEKSNEKECNDAAEEDEEKEEYSNAEQLEMLTSYLRTSYRFCFWCGVRYKDAEDLDSNCPGLTRDEH